MKYTKYILSIVIPFGLLYLIGSFVYISFNFYNWSYESRVVYAVVGSIVSLYNFIHNLAMDLSGLNNIEVIDHETVEYDVHSN